MKFRGQGEVRPLVVLSGLVVLALGLRLLSLRSSMFGDELFLYQWVHGRSLADVLTTVRDIEKTPPLGFILAWVFDRGSHADILIRVPSLLAGLAVVPLLYHLGERTFGRRAGLLAATWMALNSFQIFYSTESRGYELVEALVLSSTLLLLIALEKRRVFWWALFATAVAAAMYSHYIAALVLAPQAVWALVVHRSQIRTIAVAHIAAALTFLPWLPGLREQIHHSAKEASGLDQSAPTTFGHISKIVGQGLIGHPFVGLDQLPGTVALIVFGLALVIAAVGAGARLARHRFSSSRAQAASLLLLLSIAPLALNVVDSLRPHTSFLLARNLIVSIPYAVLLICAGVTAVRPRSHAVGTAVALLGVLTVGAVDSQRRIFQRPDARWAAGRVDRGPPSAVVISGQLLFSEIPPGKAFTYYLTKPHDVFDIASANAAWAQAARRHVPLITVSPGGTVQLAFVNVPPRYRRRFRLGSTQTRDGFGTGQIVRTWLPIA